MSRKAFTVPEANALIPELEDVLREIERQRETAREHHQKLQILDALWGPKLTQAGNPDHDEFLRHRQGIATAARAIDWIVHTEILGRGVRFPQGGLEHGLLDFPTTWEGRWIYLCWRIGEPEVTTWHETHAGYAGRQDITEEQKMRMGAEDDAAELDDSMLDF